MLTTKLNSGRKSIPLTISIEKDKKRIKPFSSWIPWVIFGAIMVYSIYSMNFVNKSNENVGETVEKKANEARVAVEKTANEARVAAEKRANEAREKERKTAEMAAQAYTQSSARIVWSKAVQIKVPHDWSQEVQIPIGTFSYYCSEHGAETMVLYDQAAQARVRSGSIVPCETRHEKVPSLGSGMVNVRLRFRSQDTPGITVFIKNDPPQDNSRFTITEINTNPSRATVFIDGQQRGRTPLYNVSVDKGHSHIIRFELERHKMESIVIKDGQKDFPVVTLSQE